VSQRAAVDAASDATFKFKKYTWEECELKETRLVF
jgi:hypothetical protein